MITIATSLSRENGYFGTSKKVNYITKQKREVRNIGWCIIPIEDNQYHIEKWLKLNRGK